MPSTVPTLALPSLLKLLYPRELPVLTPPPGPYFADITQYLIGFLIHSQTADPDTVLLALLVHDLPEARVGDANSVAQVYTSADEVRAISDQLSQLGGFGESMLRLWHQVEEKETPEGVLGKDCDRLEMVIEALRLLDLGISGARDWITSPTPVIKTDIGRRILEEVLRRCGDDT